MFIVFFLYDHVTLGEGLQNSLFCKEDKLDTFSNELHTGKSVPSKSYGSAAAGINNAEKNDNIRFKDSAGTGEMMFGMNFSFTHTHYI